MKNGVSFFKFIIFSRERERERIPSRLPTVSTEAYAGLELRNREIRT